MADSSSGRWYFASVHDVCGLSDSGLSADLPSYLRIRDQLPEAAAQPAGRTSAHRGLDPFIPPNPSPENHSAVAVWVVAKAGAAVVAVRRDHPWAHEKP